MENVVQMELKTANNKHLSLVKLQFSELYAGQTQLILATTYKVNAVFALLLQVRKWKNREVK